MTVPALITIAHAPVSLATSSRPGLSMFVAALTSVVGERVLRSGHSVGKALNLTPTALFKVLIHGTDPLFPKLDSELKAVLEEGEVPVGPEIVRLLITVVMKDLLSQYNVVVEHPVGVWNIGTCEDWVGRELGGNPMNYGALVAKWNAADDTLFQDFVAALRAKLSDPIFGLVRENIGPTEPRNKYAKLNAVMNPIEAGLEAVRARLSELAAVKLPKLAALSPAPTAEEVKHIPWPLRPKVAEAEEDDWNKYPRFEFSFDGDMEILLADEPLSVVVDPATDQIRLSLAVKRARFTDLEVTVYWYIAWKNLPPTGKVITNGIVRLKVVCKLNSGHVELTDLSLLHALAPTWSRPKGTEELTLRDGPTFNSAPGFPLVEFNAAIDLPKVAKTFRDLAQGVDAILLPGDVVPTEAVLEAQIAAALKQALRDIIRTQVSVLMDTAVAAATSAGLDLPTATQLFNNLAWRERPNGEVLRASSDPTLDHFIQDGFLAIRWRTDFPVKTPIAVMPLVNHHPSILSKDRSIVLVADMDYLSHQLGLALAMSLVAGEGFLRTSSIDVVLRPALPEEEAARGRVLNLSVRWDIAVGRSQVVTATFNTWVKPGLADHGAAESVFFQDVDPAVRSWVEANPEHVTPETRDLVHRSPYVPCIRLQSATDEAVEVSLESSAPPQGPVRRAVEAALAAVLPFPFAVGPMKDDVTRQWETWEANRRYLSFRWPAEG